MSQENVEIVREMYEANARGDVETALAALHPDVVWVNDAKVPGLGGTFHGHGGVLDLFSQIGEIFDDYQTEPERMIEAGELVVVLMRESGRAGASGIELSRRIGVVYTFRGGKIERVAAYADPADALADAGLSASGDDG